MCDLRWDGRGARCDVADRDDRYLLAGGVFDVDGDEVAVPSTPKITPGKPKLFAITIAAPGGVVVGAREHVVVTATR